MDPIQQLTNLKAQALEMAVQRDDLREQAEALDAQYRLVMKYVRVLAARIQQAQEMQAAAEKVEKDEAKGGILDGATKMLQKALGREQKDGE